MSELMNYSAANRGLRGHLFATASGLALASVFASIHPALAEDHDGSPTVWVELGGQLERVDSGQEAFAPSFFNTISANGFTSPLEFDHPARYSTGLEGAISFLPRDSAWKFSAAVRYGRSMSHKFLHEQKPGEVSHYVGISKSKYKTAPPQYSELKADSSETHLIADFQAGRDVGLGIFGKESTSTISFGVRFAQFTSKSDDNTRARPDMQFTNIPTSYFGVEWPESKFHQYLASVQRNMGFHGIGPSISWNASAPLIGNAQTSEVTLDWGVNAAVLFGRQKAATSHMSYGRYYYHNQNKYQRTTDLPGRSNIDKRSHAVVVPNLGGFAGISVRYDQAKISFGYRADIFFGAMDGGIDTHKAYDRDFYGPFATVRIGLGG